RAARDSRVGAGGWHSGGGGSAWPCSWCGRSAAPIAGLPIAPAVVAPVSIAPMVMAAVAADGGGQSAPRADLAHSVILPRNGSTRSERREAGAVPHTRPPPRPERATGRARRR